MIRRFRTLRLVMGFALAVSIAQPLLASTVLYRTDAQLIALSERVVHARVVAQRVAGGGPDGQAIYTVTTLDVLEDFTAQPGETIDVWELGGVVGNEAQYVGGAVTYALGREVLVCLERGPNGWRSIAMGFSKFDVSPRAGGDAGLTRSSRDTVVLGGRQPPGERTLDEFRRLAAVVTGRASIRRVGAPALELRSADAPFTLFQGGWRWTQADTGTPVPWYRNTTAPPPVAGDAVNEIQTALAAWTSPPSAFIVLQYAGRTSQVVAKGPWTGIANGNGVITFEDPNDEMSSLTLAIGGGAANATPGSGGTINGQPYFAFNRGYVIFQNVADLGPEFTASLGFTRVLEHEIGHAIGLGHTDDDLMVVNPASNIMNSACCYPETPIPPAIGPDDLAGLNFIYPSNLNGPTIALDKASLRFAGVIDFVQGFPLLVTTGSQAVRLTQSGPGAVTWTATPSVPWLSVAPSSGTGSATVSVAIAMLAPQIQPSGTATIAFVFSGASNNPGPINVTWTFAPSPLQTFGAFDTPIDHSTGATGAVPFTGWALDSIDVIAVRICRETIPGEQVGVSVLCNSTAQVYVGDATFVDGARPDVAAAFPTYPRSSRAGWGFMVLTNMLPAQGNGTYVFHAYAFARPTVGLQLGGLPRAIDLGTKTLTAANASATTPFGAIDTPEQGGFASGAGYINFGWALTPQTKTIPFDGSTITVLVDGASVGTANYNHFRSDVASIFPGRNNSNGAVGFKIIDTTTLANGQHTISWTVTDDGGATEGIGSRFFTVSNGIGALTAASVPTRTAERGASVPRLDAGPVLGRRGWDLKASLRAFAPDASGRVVVRSEEVNRVELHLGPGYDAGYLKTHDGLQALPIGSHLDATTGVFTWAPGVGFVGAYDLVFVRADGPDSASRRDVRLILAPKGSGLVGPQVVIDAPRWQQDVGQPFVLGGWAADLDAAQGTGIATLHAWAYPLTGGPPVFLGATAYGGARPDVAAVHGEQFEASGFGLVVQVLTPGHYDLAVFAWSIDRAGFAPAKVVRITVR